MNVVHKNIIKEHHPHISNRLELLWGSNEFDVYVQSLFLNDRDPPRKGFDYKVLVSLVHLANEHRAKFPMFYKASLWDV